MCFSNVRCPRELKTTYHYKWKLAQEMLILLLMKNVMSKLFSDKELKCWLEGKTCIDGPYTSHFDVHFWIIVQRASHLNNNIRAPVLMLLFCYPDMYALLIQLLNCGPYNYITIQLQHLTHATRKIFEKAIWLWASWFMPSPSHWSKVLKLCYPSGLIFS